LGDLASDRKEDNFEADKEGNLEAADEASRLGTRPERYEWAGGQPAQPAPGDSPSAETVRVLFVLQPYGSTPLDADAVRTQAAALKSALRRSAASTATEASRAVDAADAAQAPEK
jgi:hypothetical protein